MIDKNILAKIEEFIKQNDVALFMKGTPARPECGFSKKVIDVLKILTPSISYINVLEDSIIREAIKQYSSWPTLPQLYINGEFIGGCDIVLENFKNGQLASLLQTPKAKEKPKIEITDEAISVFEKAIEKDKCIRLLIDSSFENSLLLDEKGKDDFVYDCGGFTVIIDPFSATRAGGLKISYEQDELEAGFVFSNPNEPDKVKDMSVGELHNILNSDRKNEVLLIDVRPKSEWNKAHIKEAKLLESFSKNDIASFDKNKKIVFHCHHGGRSLRVAESFRQQGFKNVYNLVGGIDSWSKNIDSTVPIY